MRYTAVYKTPAAFDDIVLQSDGTALTGLWFCGGAGAPACSTDTAVFSSQAREESTAAGTAASSQIGAVFAQTAAWLDVYFAGGQPDFMPPLRLEGLSPFQWEVTALLMAIPCGEVCTYGELAAAIAAAHGTKKMSAQAVGGAVGRNPISILVPCHRVVGANGALTGYGGGIQNKLALLTLEGHDPKAFTLPRQTE